jgi:hypothetical protein
MVLEQQQAKGLLCVRMNSNDPSYFLNEKRGQSQFFSFLGHSNWEGFLIDSTVLQLSKA